MAKETLHVVPHEEGWGIKREGNGRSSSNHTTQKEAIEAARELAKDQDNIVIHRTDGTIRERITYSGPDESGNNAPGVAEVKTRDVMSVGTRVNWGAVLAGVVVAMALYVTMSFLAFAIGLSTVDNMTGKTFAVTAALIAGFTLLVTMFLGGFVASRITVGEDKNEAITYGVLVWGTTMLLLLSGGLGLGLGMFGGLRQLSASQGPTASADTMKQELNLTDQQAERYAAVTNEARGLSEKASPQALAWWTFSGLLLSLMAAIAGGALGAGPDLETWRWRSFRTNVPVPNPA
jgi:hypothetical protein